MERDYDVVVVGAGPAGATAALVARRSGLSVLRLDKRRFPRDKICGDAVARKSLRYLRELGLLERVRAQTHEPIGAAILGAPNGTTLAIDLHDRRAAGGAEAKPHIICRREIFDNVLWEAARQESEALEGCAVTDVLFENGGVRGVEYQSAGAGISPTRVSAGIVIAADGFNSIVARKLGVYRHDPDRWYVATRAYYSGLDCPRNTVEVHFVEETLPGFLWMFPTGDGITNVGLGMIHSDVRKCGKSLREVHETVVGSPRFRDRFARAERIGGIHGWNIPSPDFSRTIHGNGFVLIGDAAGLVDPFSGEGIGNAMCSASIAARLAADAVSADADRDRILGQYPQLLWKAVDASELRLHYRLRALARRCSLVNFLVGRAAKHRDVLEWLTGMTAEEGAVDRKHELTSPWTYLKLLLGMKRGRRSWTRR
jgi:geranylgeranyl reductase family protein